MIRLSGHQNLPQRAATDPPVCEPRQAGRRRLSFASVSPLVSEVRQLLDNVLGDAPEAARTTVERSRHRIDEPLRVAVAGRVKAGKSTLLNALLGQPIAATDSAECTMIVTRYEHGPEARAWAVTNEDRAARRLVADDHGARRVGAG
jgi:ATPase subunit of ABC transporter with duplicated ATPase domains